MVKKHFIFSSSEADASSPFRIMQGSHLHLSPQCQGTYPPPPSRNLSTLKGFPAKRAFFSGENSHCILLCLRSTHRTIRIGIICMFSKQIMWVTVNHWRWLSKQELIRLSQIVFELHIYPILLLWRHLDQRRKLHVDGVNQKLRTESLSNPPCSKCSLKRGTRVAFGCIQKLPVIA